MRAKGTRVILQIAGFCGSEPAILLKAADEVYITERSHISLEEVSRPMAGNAHEAEEHLYWLKQLQKQQHALLTTSNLSRKKLREKTRFKPWHIDADEAVRLGLARQVSSMPAALVRPRRIDLASDLPEASTLADRKILAEIVSARAQAELAGLKLLDTRSGSARNGMVRYFGAVNNTSASAAKTELVEALRLSEGDITVLIDSPGGVVLEGFGFMDLCLQAREAGRVINTEVLGYAASMGGIILQLGEKRTMGANSWLLIHQLSSWFGWTSSEFENRLSRSMRLQEQGFALLASRSIFTAEEIIERCRSKDWWIPARKALKYGFIDEIR